MKRHLAARTVAAALALILSAAVAIPTAGQTTTAATASTQASQPAASRPTRRQLWAYRAARAQAACGLGEKVRALPWARNSAKFSWLDEPDLVLDAALLAVAEDVNVVRGQDGMCEVTLQLPHQKFRAALNAICRQRKSQPYSDELSLPDTTALRSTAKAAAPAALAGGEMIVVESGRDAFDQADPHVRQFWNQHVSDAGREKAEAGAWADAMSRLGKQIADYPISTGTTLGEYVRSIGDEVDMGQFLLAARRKRIGYEADAAVVVAEVGVSLPTVYACVKAHLHARGDADPAEIRRMEELIVAAGGKSIRQLGLGWAEKEHLLKDAPELQAAAALAAQAPDWLAGPLTMLAVSPVAGDSPELEAQARAAAAAALDARLGLAELLGRLEVPSLGTVAQLASRSRAARAELLTVLQDARPLGRTVFTPDGAAAAVILPAETLWRLVFSWQRKPPPAGE